MPDALLLLGVVVGAHGVRGEVRIRSFSDAPEAIADYGVLTSRAGDAAFRIERHRIARGMVIARLAGVNGRAEAEALKGTELYVRREALPEPDDEDEFYHADLVGLRAELRDGTTIGRVVAMQNFGAGDMMEIEPEGGGETLFVPFTRTSAPDVDVERGRIVVVPLPEVE